MKVIFLKDVPKIGRKGEVKEVADGFAYNNLIPRKLAAPATVENVKRAEQQKAAVAHAKEEHITHLQDIATRSSQTPLALHVSANAQGHLFKGVRASDIVAALQSQFGVSLEERDVVLPTPLKEAGEHEIVLRAQGFEGVLKLSIVASH